MLILALSDAYIPERAIDLPIKFQKLLSASKNKISQVLLLGNCNKSVKFVEFLEQKVCDNIISIKGESDYQATQLPYNAIVPAGNFKIGLTSGFLIVPKNDVLSLLTISRQLDVDILLWGGTHNVEAYVLENKLFINPGSCTGAFNADWVMEEAEATDGESDLGEGTGSQVLEEEVSKLNISETGTDLDEAAADQEVEEADKAKNLEKASDVEDQKASSEASKAQESGKRGTGSKEPLEEDKADEPGNAKNAESEEKMHEDGHGAPVTYAETAKKNEDLSSTQHDKSVEKDTPQDNGSGSDNDQDESETDSDDDELVSSIPSFCLLDVQESVCSVYIYTYVDDEVKVDKVKYEKQ
ncbi:hypothetical protein ACO0RG_000706 [Hanseniaspora osmophila]|uniref:Vacuolar protein sorting-associated protein 29 n=1 Tax=Hanseniaspora osmophila TaxID=56408 RepID=A0A1E5R217_9ASCO|nr:Vacuolar protein sorting-associated protein 29 [Hanseniaspora osmophila]